MATKTERLASALTHEAIRQNKVILLGWESYNAIVLPKDAPEIQRSECRQAFFAGAKHLFDCMMHVLDPGDEASEADLARMESISKELDRYGDDFARRHIKTRGSA